MGRSPSFSSAVEVGNTYDLAGQIFLVREITRMAGARGVKTIVDGPLPSRTSRTSCATLSASTTVSTCTSRCSRRSAPASYTFGGRTAARLGRCSRHPSRSAKIVSSSRNSLRIRQRTTTLRGGRDVPSGHRRRAHRCAHVLPARALVGLRFEAPVGADPQVARSCAVVRTGAFHGRRPFGRRNRMPALGDASRHGRADRAR